METSAQLGILNNLISQFGSPLDCFRELVQNSIDAGSSAIDVWSEYLGDAGAEGAIVIHVDDRGEGMDRAIIDRQFTRLFSSTKRRDLTKIGKFGIGFVSVFALQPQAVIVRTGKDGNYWEVFFHADRSFQITALPDPVEGTQISIVIAGDILRYDELVQGIRKTLKHWCRHALAEVSFEDRTPIDGSPPVLETINEDFLVQGITPIEITEGSTEMALAYSFSPEHTFFNRGLTLASGSRATESLQNDAPRFGHISFKISSPYFEHTLTRETIIRDEHYERGLAILRRAADTALLAGLLQELETLVARETWELPEIKRYNTFLDLLRREPEHSLRKAANRKILRLVNGKAATPEDLARIWRRDGRVLLTATKTPLLEELLENEIPVFWGRPPGPNQDVREFGPAKRFLRHYLDFLARTSLGGRLRSAVRSGARRSAPIAAPEDVYFPVEIDDEIHAAHLPLLKAVQALMHREGSRFARLTTCTITSAERETPLFLTAPKLAPLMARPPEAIARTNQTERLEAAINRDHRHFQRLLSLYETHPEVAARFLSRCLDLRALEPEGDPDRLASPSPMTLLSRIS